MFKSFKRVSLDDCTPSTSATATMKKIFCASLILLLGNTITKAQPESVSAVGGLTSTTTITQSISGLFVPTSNGVGTNTVLKDLYATQILTITNGNSIAASGLETNGLVLAVTPLSGSLENNFSINVFGTNLVDFAQIRWLMAHGVNVPELKFQTTGKIAIISGYNGDGTTSSGRGDIQIGVGASAPHMRITLYSDTSADSGNVLIKSGMPILFIASYISNGVSYAVGDRLQDGNDLPALRMIPNGTNGLGYFCFYDEFNYNNWAADSQERFRIRVAHTTANGGITVFGTAQITNISDTAGNKLIEFDPVTAGGILTRTNMFFEDANGNQICKMLTSIGQWTFGPSGGGSDTDILGQDSGSGLAHTYFRFGTAGNYFGKNGLSIGAAQTAVSNTLEVTGTATITGNTYINGGTSPIFTLVQTNFISGFIYSNPYNAPILVSATATLIEAVATAGSTELQLRAISSATNYAGNQTSGTSLAATNSVPISIIVPSGGTYTFTNTSTGSGNSASVRGGQILVY